jgi:hypothetical protein
MEFINPMLPDRLSKHTILKNFFIFTASLYILNETIYLKHFFTPNVPSDTTLWRSLPRHYVQRHAFFPPHLYITTRHFCFQTRTQFNYETSYKNHNPIRLIF